MLGTQVGHNSCEYKESWFLGDTVVITMQEENIPCWLWFLVRGLQSC